MAEMPVSYSLPIKRPTPAPPVYKETRCRLTYRRADLYSECQSRPTKRLDIWLPDSLVEEKRQVC